MSAQRPARLRLSGVLPLPVAVETAACTAQVGGELRLLVNRAGGGTTEQLRLRTGGVVEALPPLPLVTAEAAPCDGLLVTGADPEGRPLVLRAAPDGSVIWQLGVPGPIPSRWPIPGCAPGPVVAWQESTEAVKVAEVGPDGIAFRRSLPAGGPPLSLAIGGDAVWAAWAARSELRFAALIGERIVAGGMPADFPADVAITARPEGATVAWTDSAGTFLATLASAGAVAGPPIAVDLGPAHQGTLALVPGPESIVWAQRGEVREGEAPSWVSTLAAPGHEPQLIEGLVFAVARWGDTLVVVQEREIRLFEAA